MAIQRRQRVLERPAKLPNERFPSRSGGAPWKRSLLVDERSFQEWSQEQLFSEPIEPIEAPLRRPRLSNGA